MNIEKTSFDNLFLVNYTPFNDNRGEFVKTIHDETFGKAGLDHCFTESFYSISNKNVIRGMHFQIPPYDHHKLVYVISGSITDVVLDLRAGSKTYGKSFHAELSSKNRRGIYIGKGFAHGFLALQNHSVVEYHTTTSQNKDYEGGIRWDSFGFDWGINSPIVSGRDSAFVCFNEFLTQF